MSKSSAPKKRLLARYSFKSKPSSVSSSVTIYLSASAAAQNAFEILESWSLLCGLRPHSTASRPRLVTDLREW